MKPCDNPFWDFSNGGESKKINTKNSGLPKLLRWSHTLRSDQHLQKAGYPQPEYHHERVDHGGPQDGAVQGQGGDDTGGGQHELDGYYDRNSTVLLPKQEEVPS